ncbi:bifunctional tetrahydrofolate synthase/dihydrofolate synthase [Psychrobium sp. nBUS_13]|uniref:bifunctional tetrahydrofolate synthase/dihydrofolate synthase n=1 Tax=Psychrobium sp. nBUS_13 TaxID=3395319 RepID=UPI003EBCC5A8
MNQSFNPNSQSLNDWLSYLESIHPQEIEMGLERVRNVARRLNLLNDLNNVILVGGTNGKGSTCAFIEQLILAAGHTTGVFSSPHLIRYNERVRINHQELPDNAHIEALRAIETARGDIALTYFEVNTLTALYLMKKANVDYVILEVGLGGRLDSTNIVDADLAVITSIDLDHQGWLGDTREQVAFEKAGIFRANQRVICGEPNPPQPLLDKARELACNISFKGLDFGFNTHHDEWQFTGVKSRYDDLAYTKLPMTNAATALAAFEALGLELPEAKIKAVIKETSLKGRLQQVAKEPAVYLDVAHNPEAGRYLAAWIPRQRANKVHVVCAMLGDKDSASTLSVIKPLADSWYLAGLDCDRGASAPQLFESLGLETAHQFEHVVSALDAAKKEANKDDLIVVFGSFFTVAAILENNNLVELT